MKKINITLGNRIKTMRNKNNFTREKLAELVDVSPRFLAEVEAGKIGVSIQTLKNICVALDVSSDYLLGIINDDKLSASEILYEKLTNLDPRFFSIVTLLINELTK